MKGERTKAACLASAMADRLAMPDDITDAERFPNIAEARAHYASLPAERRAQLEAEWNLI